MTNTTSTSISFVLAGESTATARVHRATCKRVASRADLYEVTPGEAIKYASASCCKPEKSATWKDAEEVAFAEPEATALAEQRERDRQWALENTAPADDTVDAEIAYRPHAKHFWIGMGREGASQLADAFGIEAVEFRNKDFTVVIPGLASELVAPVERWMNELWDAAAAALVTWRAEQEPLGYRGWPLRKRVDADRVFLRGFVRGAAAALGAEDSQLHGNAAEVAVGYLTGHAWGSSVPVQDGVAQDFYAAEH